MSTSPRTHRARRGPGCRGHLLTVTGLAGLMPITVALTVGCAGAQEGAPSPSMADEGRTVAYGGPVQPGEALVQEEYDDRVYGAEAEAPPPSMDEAPPADAPQSERSIARRDRRAKGRIGAKKSSAVQGEHAQRPVSPSVAPPGLRAGDGDFNTEAYAAVEENDFHAVTDSPLSTFSIDVDTASYANMRRFLAGGSLPPADAVRIEELVNYFPYDYAQPRGDVPFAVHTETAQCPWNADARLVKIGIKGKEVAAQQVPARNLVFLLDVSGSMNSPNKLPLLKSSMALLAQELRPHDTISIVVYAGASGVVLPPTSGDRRADIMAAFDRLEAGGSTNGAAGIELAYRVAQDHFDPQGINRVILATDGDFNVGVSSQGELARLIEKKRESGVFLSVLGFGMGNYKDSTMEMLADKGNGNYAYIDTIEEARKVLVEQAGATLMTIAKDVKIQVEFNPAEVVAYRLIGYENRKLANRDFNDDTKDAGEIGAGHTITAMYEVVPSGRAVGRPEVDPLRYQGEGALTGAAGSGELMHLKLRYKQPQGHRSKLLSFAVHDDDRDIDEASVDLRFAASVAEFGMLLRGSKFSGDASFAGLRRRAAGALGQDRGGYRAEFLALVDRAASLRGETTARADIAR